MRTAGAGRFSRYTGWVTCADCDLSGRCPCVMRRLERLRAKGLMPTGAHADQSCFVEECQPIASNQATFDAAMSLLRDLKKT